MSLRLGAGSAHLMVVPLTQKGRLWEAQEVAYLIGFLLFHGENEELSSRREI